MLRRRLLRGCRAFRLTQPSPRRSPARREHERGSRGHDRHDGSANVVEGRVVAASRARSRPPTGTRRQRRGQSPHPPSRQCRHRRAQPRPAVAARDATPGRDSLRCWRRSGRWAERLLRAAELEDGAVDDRPTRSASVAASSKSWVTSRVGARGPRSARAALRARPLACTHRALTTARRVGGCQARVQAPGRARRAAARLGDVARVSRREMVDAKALEQFWDVPSIAGTVGDVATHVEMRKERVLLEYEPDSSALRRDVDSARVSSHVSEPSATTP